MEYGYLRGTGLYVSRVCLGAMNFGTRMPGQDEVDGAVAAAIDAGINFFDTADQYADGRSEEMLGKALGARRKDAVIASKVGYPCMDKKAFSLSRGSILSGVDGSLRRLGTDYLDIYYLHAPDPNTPLEESLCAMNDVVRQGKARYVGMSNYAAWQICDALHICGDNRWAAPVVSETCYNAITRGAENELVPFLMKKSIGMTVFNPLGGGMLTGKYRMDAPIAGTRFENPTYRKRYWREDNFRAVDELRALADGADMSLMSLSFAWLMSREWVSSIITGFSSLEQLKANLKAASVGPLPQETLLRCDEIWQSINGGRVQYNR